MIACDESNCSVECASFLASFNSCIATGDPSATIGGGSSDCDSCQAGIGAWAGVGCNGPLVACSYDLTCCTTCDGWINNGEDGDNLCEQPPPGTKTSIDYSIDLSSCVCSTGCAGSCGGVCADNGFGFKYIDNSKAPSFKCAACIFGTCGAQYSACSTH